jgi:hypothetical protein
MANGKRDVLGYIHASIRHARGGSAAAPPGGFSRGLDRDEAELVELTVRETLSDLGVAIPPAWSPSSAHHAQRLHDAYANKGLGTGRLRLK